MLNLDNLDFEMPQELGKEDKELNRKQIEKNNEKKSQNQGAIEVDEKKEEKVPEEEKVEEIAKKKKVPSQNILLVREDLKENII